MIMIMMRPDVDDSSLMKNEKDRVDFQILSAMSSLRHKSRKRESFQMWNSDMELLEEELELHIRPGKANIWRPLQ